MFNSNNLKGTTVKEGSKLQPCIYCANTQTIYYESKTKSPVCSIDCYNELQEELQDKNLLTSENIHDKSILESTTFGPCFYCKTYTKFKDYCCEVRICSLECYESVNGLGK